MGTLLVHNAYWRTCASYLHRRKDEIYAVACDGLRTLAAFTDNKMRDKFPEEPEPMPLFADMTKYLHERVGSF